MCVVLSNINIKGGIGKTIGNATMAEILAKCGKRVLLVDNDPQCNMTGLFGRVGIAGRPPALKNPPPGRTER